MKRPEIKKLDTLWSQIVKLYANNKCEVCRKDGKYVRLNACHIVGRRHRATRWGAWFKVDGKRFYDLCGFSGCYQDHMQYDEHGPKEKFIREEILTQERYERVRALAMQTVATNQNFDEIQNNLLKVKKECQKKKKK